MLSWGILSPDELISHRRLGHLGLTSSIRHFNERAVPELGGMWFAMPLIWSVVAIHVANTLKVSALPMANAIEALMMRDGHAQPEFDPRVRGTRKLYGRTDWSYKALHRHDAYVTQPLRMAMLQPLKAFRLAEGGRYGGLRIAERGESLLKHPIMQQATEALIAWAKGGNPNSKALGRVRKILDPRAVLPNDIVKFVFELLFAADTPRSSRRLSLVALGKGPSKAQLESPVPMNGIDPEHWQDMRAGVSFMELHRAAVRLRDDMEQVLLHRRNSNLGDHMSKAEMARKVAENCKELRNIAQQGALRIRNGKDGPSIAFLDEVLTANDEVLCRNIAGRDRSVLIVSGHDIALGPAAGDAPNQETQASVEIDNEGAPPSPSDFASSLYRLYNLHCLFEELSGRANPSVPKAQDDE